MSSEIYLLYENPKGSSEVYELSCTTDIMISKRTRTTESRVENNFIVSDHIVRDPLIISLKGVLTNIQNYSLEYYLPPEEVITRLSSLVDQGVVFTLYVDDSLNPIEDVVINTFDVRKSSAMGTSWAVDLVCKQLIVAAQASFKKFPPQANPEQSEEQSAQGSNNTEKKDLEQTAAVQFLGNNIEGAGSGDLSVNVIRQLAYYFKKNFSPDSKGGE